MERRLLNLLLVQLAWAFCFPNVALSQQQPQPKPPDPMVYRPHYFQHVQEPWAIDRPIGCYIKRDGAKFRPNVPAPLPPECWAITYWFIWNGEDDYDNKGRDHRPDPEPVIIFVADDGRIVGMQSRIHCIWAPIAVPQIYDIHSGTHVMVGFEAWPVWLAEKAGIPRPKNPKKQYWYVHSPVCGQVGVQWINLNGGTREKGHSYPLMPVSERDYPWHCK